MGHVRGGTSAAERGFSCTTRLKEDDMEGKKDKVVGTIKEKAGKLTGDDRLEAEGQTQKIKGHIKDAAETTEEKIKGVRDGLKDGDSR
jgi:uncharacterized protein YjbJ (UPF0337 family)